ncbi:MAG TPA: aminodeoxychorismate synthase component I [Candidatus Omnitrophica bacterium]|nr:aminodeoxychorismate synthase component I [Candidatus Omnitrophota bacterium]
MPYLIYKSFDWKQDAWGIFEAIKDKQNVFFLDSSLRRPALGRYSFLGFDPFYILKAKGQKDSLNQLRELLKRYKLVNPKFPFLGGAVGYLAYDFGLSLENIEERAKDDLGIPDVFFGFYDTIIALDHWQRKLTIFSTGFPERSGLAAKKRAKERLRQVVGLLPQGRKHIGKMIPIGRPQGTAPTANFTKEGYFEAVNKAKDYIRKGDIYQVNLSQRFSAETALNSFDLYQKLRRASPSDFSAYLDCGDFQIISSSPERFLNFYGKKVSTRPMKGTRPRGINPQADARHKRDLLQSPKDKAELLMIVDLMRNDLGRVCKYGSIRVSSMRELEAYSTVYQTTASIEGVLHPDKDRIDLLKACFPGGSITGCPKIRSMEIIEELEPTKRAIYTGSLGYFGFNNTMNLNILIRTILKKNGKIYFQTGGGIVADSRAENEYQETLTKAQGIFSALKGVYR